MCLCDILTLKRSSQTHTFILLSLFTKIQLKLGIKFFSLHTYAYFKKSFLKKGVTPFLKPELHWMELSFWLLDLHPKFYHQTRGDFISYFLQTFSIGFLRQKVFFLLIYPHFSLNILYSFLHSWSLSYWSKMNDFIFFFKRMTLITHLFVYANIKFAT